MRWERGAGRSMPGGTARVRVFLSGLFFVFFGVMLVLCDLSLPGQQTRMNYHSVFVFIRPSRCFFGRGGAVAARRPRQPRVRGGDGEANEE